MPKSILRSQLASLACLVFLVAIPASEAAGAEVVIHKAFEPKPTTARENQEQKAREDRDKKVRERTEAAKAELSKTSEAKPNEQERKRRERLARAVLRSANLQMRDAVADRATIKRSADLAMNLHLEARGKFVTARELAKRDNSPKNLAAAEALRTKYIELALRDKTATEMLTAAKARVERIKEAQKLALAVKDNKGAYLPPVEGQARFAPGAQALPVVQHQGQFVQSPQVMFQIPGPPGDIKGGIYGPAPQPKVAPGGIYTPAPVGPAAGRGYDKVPPIESQYDAPQSAMGFN